MLNKSARYTHLLDLLDKELQSPTFRYDEYKEILRDMFEENKVSESFINKYLIQQHVSYDPHIWKTLFSYQDVTEKFIEEVEQYWSGRQSTVIWNTICTYQNLSVDFVRRHKSSIFFKNLIHEGTDINVFLEFEDHYDNWNYLLTAVCWPKKQLLKLLNKEWENEATKIKYLSRLKSTT